MTGPLTHAEREQLDRWDAAEDLIRVTDHARELRQAGRLTEVDRDLVAMAERAWDAVRGAS